MTLTLTGGRLIDGTGADPVERATIALEGDRIAAISGSAKNRDGDIIDCAGLTVLPGLIDAHAHLGLVFDFGGDPGAMSPAEIAAQTFRNCELCLDAGFTTVRDMCGVDGGLVRALASGLVRGPRVYPSGPAIVQTGGHGHINGPFCFDDHYVAIPGLVQLTAICDGADQVRRQARLNFRRGATQLKAFISGGVVSTTDRLEDTQLTVEELRAAVLEARARETYVAGHAHNNQAIRNGLEAGLECFEHGTMLDEATAAAMARANAALDPTLAVTQLLAQNWKEWKLPESVVPRIAGCERMMEEAMRIARAAGVLIGSGSDLLGTEQNRRGLELTLQARVLGAMEAIVCATSSNARIMHQEKLFGSIEAGKLADIIAINGDPLAQPELFDDPSRVVLVIQGGKTVKNLL
ncbi:MAG: amidohydrolase family protein [Candidatus Eremiobacteraeota bacterium]|nr:amidohydrolase family protein [Candidatus Eremiobacteraeota bacterium]MBV8280964.1 amidohydrolase family protein [Candidatus Eremiobacteraeota bacterium]